MTIEARQAGETAKEYAYRIIKENIITLELEPGSTLNDMEISQMIGISRTPVREAIIKLKEESDIIEIFPQRGMRIALIDTDIVQEVRFLRLTLEKAMVELASGCSGSGSSAGTAPQPDSRLIHSAAARNLFFMEPPIDLKFQKERSNCSALGLPVKRLQCFTGKEGCVRETQEGVPAPLKSFLGG